ncbi:T9SS type A sorting domain-containing protein [Litoribaculum gwangyangense]|uniref:Secretion system C-terminal sorting domain-containing protein n=1 Tax=Litoribaculum gwangyangense TaxID=1130722 RepID=A0ABP9CQW3_9FLAO
MKTKLLSLFFISTLLGFSQANIEQLQSATGSQYLVLSGSIDQSIDGANISWDFTNLTNTTILLTDTYSVTGPNSTIQTNEGSTIISTIGLNNNGGEIAVTSALSSGIQLNYTNFAIIGTFPLSFGYSNTDSVEGVFSGAVSGNVLNTSTINVSVDAWGNLKVGTFDGPVTRLKIIQNLNLLVGGIVPGTATQTSYFYYDANSDDLIFRSTRLQVPVAGIDDTTLESLSSYTLSTTNNQKNDFDLKLSNNPVEDVLHFVVTDLVEIKAITISDMAGRIVYKTDTSATSLNISQLETGLFMVSVSTNKGLVTKKFLKK